MAVPSYTTDLVTIDAAGAGTIWTELGTWSAAGTLANPETDYYIQGANCVSCAVKTGIGGLTHPAVSAQTFPTDGAFLVWMKYDAPNSLEPISNGGIRTIIGSSNTAFWGYIQGGSDTYTYGGWQCIPTGSPAAVANDYAVGSPTTSYTNFGWAYNALTVPGKGNPYGVDAIRIGRCEARFANGSTADGYATFPGFAAQNDTVANRWGLIQAVAGGYQWQGLMTFGYTNAVDFRDSNRVITIPPTVKKVTSGFNKIEIRQATSNVFWTNISISSLSTASRGTLTVVDNANVVFDTCAFTDMGTFSFLSGSTITGTTFRRCLAVTANSSNLQSSVFTNYQGATNTSALVWGDNTDTNGKLDGCVFTHGTVANSCHGLAIANQSPTSITLTNVTFAGYSTANGNPNSAIHVLKSSGSLTINITGGTTPSILTEGAAVTVVSGSVDVTVYAKTAEGTNVSDARVFLRASDGTGPFPYNESITIVNTGTSANVHHTAHGMATNDKVVINGASHWQNNGVFTITKISDDYYNCTLLSAPGSNPTGTITSTFVALEGLTVSGTITTSRVYSSNQPVTGWIRKSSGSPYYKTAPLTGTIDSGAGFTATGVMILDE